MHRFRVHRRTDYEATLAEGVVWSDGAVDVHWTTERPSQYAGNGNISYSSIRACREDLEHIRADVEFVDVPETDWCEPATAED